MPMRNFSFSFYFKYLINFPKGGIGRAQGLNLHFTTKKQRKTLCSIVHLVRALRPRKLRVKIWKDRRFVCEYLVTKIRFHDEELLAPRPTPKLEDHPLSAVRVCLLNIFAATLHIGGRPSIRSLRTRHVVVTGTHLSHRDQ
jgi:hypothetical protein